MMLSQKMVQAFEIFAKYEEQGHKISLWSSHHDEICAGPNPSVVSDEDVAVLESLGWTNLEEYECFMYYA